MRRRRPGLRTPPGVRTTWLPRGDRPHGQALTEAVRALLEDAPPAVAPTRPALPALPDIDVDDGLL